MNYISERYKNPSSLRKEYIRNNPFPHIVLDNFIDTNFLEKVLSEFPDLRNLKNKIEFKDQKQIKFASKGFADLSPSCKELVSYLNSDLFLKYLQELTGIKEILISDPYLSGGGYHEIKKGGVLKVHADFNKHPYLDLDRRINLLLYLNKNWESSWGGNIELFDIKNLSYPAKSIEPLFNRCLIFSTTSYTYHGHPKELTCPESKSRKSIALYYFSSGRPKSEISNKKHSTLFIAASGEKYKLNLKEILINWVPPIILKKIKSFKNKF
tara:strand:+ start:292 stop:1095 length:804 start_codon:yes stop_codon:yes gene_type:complete